MIRMHNFLYELKKKIRCFYRRHIKGTYLNLGAKC